MHRVRMLHSIEWNFSLWTTPKTVVIYSTKANSPIPRKGVKNLWEPCQCKSHKWGTPCTLFWRVTYLYPCDLLQDEA